MEEAINKYWPTFIFILDNYQYKWTPNQYFFNDTNKIKIRGCMGFNSGSGKRFTMGSTWMIGHEIIFDSKNNKIGIVEANCDKNNNSNNQSMNYIGIEEGYNNEDMLEQNNMHLIDYILNENMLSLYILIAVILFLIIIYLVIVLIHFKKRRPNPWLWFIEKEYDDEENSFIPIKYDINDSSNKNEQNKNNKDFSTVFLANSDNNNKEIKNSKYSKINT